eukprot:scaffold23661_cov113-Isochrysis_galbana.AAC.2
MSRWYTCSRLISPGGGRERRRRPADPVGQRAVGAGPAGLAQAEPSDAAAAPRAVVAIEAYRAKFGAAQRPTRPHLLARVAVIPGVADAAGGARRRVLDGVLVARVPRPIRVRPQAGAAVTAQARAVPVGQRGTTQHHQRPPQAGEPLLLALDRLFRRQILPRAPAAQRPLVCPEDHRPDFIVREVGGVDRPSDLRAPAGVVGDRPVPADRRVPTGHRAVPHLA